MAKKNEVEGPTKAKIEYLLRNGFFVGRYNESDDSSYAAYREVYDEYERRQEEFNQTKAMKALKAKSDRLHDEYLRRRKVFEDRLVKIRRQFYAKGMTPSVLKAISDYADELNSK